MVKRLFLALLLFSSCIASSCLAQEKAVTGPKEEIKQDNLWDFGRVKEGKVLAHNFLFKNNTPKELNIKNVHTSCGCTASEVKKKKLAPGEETTIGVKFDTTGYSGATSQFIYVNTDNLDNPVIKYIIKADVQK